MTKEVEELTVSVGEDETKLKTKRRVVRLVSNAGENTRLLEVSAPSFALLLK